MNQPSEFNDAGLARAQRAREPLLHGRTTRKLLALLAVALAATGLTLNWSWLVAAGIAPILLALAPCAAMCALGVCMNRKGCSPDEAARADRNRIGETT